MAAQIASASSASGVGAARATPAAARARRTSTNGADGSSCGAALRAALGPVGGPTP